MLLEPPSACCQCDFCPPRSVRSPNSDRLSSSATYVDLFPSQSLLFIELGFQHHFVHVALHIMVALLHGPYQSHPLVVDSFRAFCKPFCGEFRLVNFSSEFGSLLGRLTWRYNDEGEAKKSSTNDNSCTWATWGFIVIFNARLLNVASADNAPRLTG